jgi:DNA-binding IclR family transcriptional regulator
VLRWALTMDKTAKKKTERAAELLNDSPIGTLERGLLLLELFDADNSEMSLGQLREKAGLPKATIQRLMKTLEARKWVTYDRVTRTYHLGASVLRISYLAASHSELVRVTHPFLIQLAEETRETAGLSGMILEGLSTADAQVLVAFGPEETWDRLLANPIEKRTGLTLTDPTQVRERWVTVRKEGVAFDWGEWNSEIPAVAAPVFDHWEQVRGAITIAPPIERASEEAMQRYGEILKATAAEISKKLA